VLALLRAAAIERYIALGTVGWRYQPIATDHASSLTVTAQAWMLTKACPIHRSRICARYANAHGAFAKPMMPCVF
jgi:hypothetical protein